MTMKSDAALLLEQAKPNSLANSRVSRRRSIVHWQTKGRHRIPTNPTGRSCESPTSVMLSMTGSPKRSYGSFACVSLSLSASKRRSRGRLVQVILVIGDLASFME